MIDTAQASLAEWVRKANNASTSVSAPMPEKKLVVKDVASAKKLTSLIHVMLRQVASLQE